MNWLVETWILRDIVRPALDVLIIAIILYQAYKLLMQTRTMHLIKAVFFIVLLYAIAYFFKLETLYWLLKSLSQFIIVAIVIVFQPELRKVFTRIGLGEWFKIRNRVSISHIESAVSAVEVLADRRRGALIVFSKSVNLKSIIETGTTINADVTSSLIVSLFAYDTPLHDGAVVIQGNKIVSAGCFLPLSKQPDIKKSFGTRHRAALGLSEETDAVVLISSEETGAMSIAYDSNIYYDLTVSEIKRLLTRLSSGRDRETEVELT